MQTNAKEYIYHYLQKYFKIFIRKCRDMAFANMNKGL